MRSPPSDFFKICKSVAHRIPYWTQGAGGNISVKDEDTLWIKASGYRLDNVSETQGFTGVQLKKFGQELAILLSRSISTHSTSEMDYSRLLLECVDPQLTPQSNRPSMEAGFHQVLPGKFVAHFHSLVAVVMAHFSKKTANNEDKKWQKWAQNHSFDSIAICPPILPGLTLAQALLPWKDHPIILLGNHGVLLQSEDPGLLDRWSQIEALFCKAWGIQPLADFQNWTYQKHDAEKTSQSLGPIPIKVYFPDTAVFLEKLLKVLEPVNPSSQELYQLKENSWTAHPDLCELWLATQILYRTCPSLDEIPPEMIASLSNMPTEKARLKKYEERS